MQATTPAQQAAMTRILRDGFVYAGTNTHKGRVERTAASTLRALERKGLVVLSLSPDGGMMARCAPSRSTSE